VSLTATHKHKAEGTRAEEESVPRHGRRGPSVQGWFKRLSDLPVFLKQISIWPLSIHTLTCWAHPWGAPVAGPMLCVVQKRSRRFYPGGAMLCCRRMLPSLHVWQTHLKLTEALQTAERFKPG